jgi:AcrR family transcriptional regulator
MQQRSRETIAAVVRAARELFGKDGFAQVSIDDVARACVRTKGAVYHHFDTKEALFEEVFRLEQRRIADVVAAATTSRDAVDALGEGITAYLDEIASHRSAARITLLDAPVVLGYQRWRSCDDGPFRTMLVATLETIADSGRLRNPDDLEAAADAILGAVTETALVIATSDASHAVAEPRARACRAIVNGLLA